MKFWHPIIANQGPPMGLFLHQVNSIKNKINIYILFRQWWKRDKDMIYKNTNYNC